MTRPADCGRSSASMEIRARAGRWCPRGQRRFVAAGSSRTATARTPRPHLHRRGQMHPVRDDRHCRPEPAGFGCAAAPRPSAGAGGLAAGDAAPHAVEPPALASAGRPRTCAPVTMGRHHGWSPARPHAPCHRWRALPPGRKQVSVLCACEQSAVRHAPAGREEIAIDPDAAVRSRRTGVLPSRPRTSPRSRCPAGWRSGTGKRDLTLRAHHHPLYRSVTAYARVQRTGESEGR